MAKQSKRKGWSQEFPGQLTATDGRFEAVKYTIASGSTFSGWIVRSTTDRFNTSDPLRNKSEAIRVLEQLIEEAWVASWDEKERTHG